MKRRDFLKAIAALPAAAYLPPAKPFDFGALTKEMLGLLVGNLTGLGKIREDYYSAVIHPGCWFDLRRLIALDLWHREYREWRKLRRAGAQVETLDALMRRVKASAEAPEVMDMRSGFAHAMTYGEVGHYENVRFITSEKLPA